MTPWQHFPSRFQAKILTNSQKCLRKHQKSALQKSRNTPHVPKADFVGKTISSKVDLIWHLRPIRKVENARTLIIFLSYFLQKLDFYDQKTYCYLMFLISTPVFHETTLFHLEPSGIYILKNILRTLTRHRRTSMFFCVLEAQAICLVSVVFDRWVAHCYVCDYRFLQRF